MLANAALLERLSDARLYARLQRLWWLVAVCVVTSMMLAILCLRAIPAQHTASMVIGPTARTGQVGRGVRITAEASAAFASAERREGEILSDFDRFLHLMTAPGGAARQMVDSDLLTILFEQEWNDQAQRWHPPATTGQKIRGVIGHIVGRESWAPPDAERISRRLKREIDISMVGETAMRRISFRHKDPAFAKALLLTLYASTDAIMRAEAERRSSAEIAFLEDRLSSLSHQGQRSALADMLESETTARMMLAVNLPVAADLVESPTAPNVPDWPDPLVVLMLFSFVGAVASLPLILLWPLHRQETKDMLTRLEATAEKLEKKARRSYQAAPSRKEEA